jgi:hypothetical protein
MEHRGVKAISLLSQPSFLCGDIMLSHQNWEQKSCSMEQRCQSNFASVPTFISVWRYHVESSKLGAEELLYGAEVSKQFRFCPNLHFCVVISLLVTPFSAYIASLNYVDVNFSLIYISCFSSLLFYHRIRS